MALVSELFILARLTPLKGIDRQKNRANYTGMDCKVQYRIRIIKQNGQLIDITNVLKRLGICKIVGIGHILPGFASCAIYLLWYNVFCSAPAV